MKILSEIYFKQISPLIAGWQPRSCRPCKWVRRPRGTLLRRMRLLWRRRPMRRHSFRNLAFPKESREKSIRINNTFSTTLYEVDEWCAAKTSFKKSIAINAYLYCIEHNLHNVARTDGFSVLLAIVIASMTELTIIISPAIICIGKGL